MDAYPPEKAQNTDTADVDLMTRFSARWAKPDPLPEPKIFPVVKTGRSLFRNPIGWSLDEADKSSSVKALAPPGTVSM